MFLSTVYLYYSMIGQLSYLCEILVLGYFNETAPRSNSLYRTMGCTFVIYLKSHNSQTRHSVWVDLDLWYQCKTGLQRFSIHSYNSFQSIASLLLCMIYWQIWEIGWLHMLHIIYCIESLQLQLYKIFFFSI